MVSEAGAGSHSFSRSQHSRRSRQGSGAPQRHCGHWRRSQSKAQGHLVFTCEDAPRCTPRRQHPWQPRGPPPQLQPAGGADEQHPWRPRGLSLQPAGGANGQMARAAAERSTHSKGDHVPLSSHATFKMKFKSSTKTGLQSGCLGEPQRGLWGSFRLARFPNEVWPAHREGCTFSGSCAVQTSTSVLRAGDTLGTPTASHQEHGSPRSGRLCAHRNEGLGAEVSLPTPTVS